MNHRTRKALDGDLPRQELTPAESAELAAAEAEIAAVLRAVPMQPLPDLAPGVMRRIEQQLGQRTSLLSAPASGPRASFGLRALLEWIWRPRPISIGWRPAYGFAGAMMLVLLVGIGRQSAPAPDGPQQVLTQFVFNAPDAQQVTLAGDFTDWQPEYELTSSEPGVWMVVVPLDPGVHSYAFIVDGERWEPDPNAPAVADGFGGFNSRMAVLAPDAVEM